MLFELMSKVVLDAEDWAGELPPDILPDAMNEKKGMPQ